MAIQQQSEQLDPRKVALPPELFDFLRCSQQGDGGRDLRIADFEQRAGARRFQHHLVAAPSQICEPRQHDNVGVAELWRLRPIIGNLRLDDDQILLLARVREAELQKTAPGQSPDQQIDFLVDLAAVGRERVERQTCAQVRHAIHRAGAELSQSD